MITIENTTLYKCEHCRKKYEKKLACELHEQWCVKNPKNFAKCGGCTYLEEKKKTIYRDAYDGEHSSYSRMFYCNKKQVEVYPLKVARLNLPHKYPEDFEGAIQMPAKCDDFEFTW